MMLLLIFNEVNVKIFRLVLKVLGQRFRRLATIVKLRRSSSPDREGCWVMNQRLMICCLEKHLVVAETSVVALVPGSHMCL